MAIVTQVSTAMNQRDPADQSTEVVDTRYNYGTLRPVTGGLSNAASDNAGSRYTLCCLPSTVILRPESALELSNWGYSNIRIGAEGQLGGLVANTSVAGISDPVNPIVLFGAKYGVELWQQLGLSEDPRSPIEIFIETTVDATGAGSMRFDLVLQTD